MKQKLKMREIYGEFNSKYEKIDYNRTRFVFIKQALVYIAKHQYTN